ncbi:hypothetical protein [Vibrio sp. T3Y01]|uniref:hypothetical protein n=1 Tax=Vibrio sp. T3Y01 TaxID=2607606 RepID=UPI0014933E6D|nr:hypothetical protein [Vibrio sp. T3Y01]NOI98151.1 hypothetical protein [Vibrio sp. T3Y01]
MEFYNEIFTKAGFLIPPYITNQDLNNIANVLKKKEALEIEDYLKHIYSEQNLASMVRGLYPDVPYINEYKDIISESIEAHFIGLDHIAVAGLMPVIEGVGMKLVDVWGIERERSTSNRKGVIALFSELAEKCKEHVITNNLGNVKAITASIDVFEYFLKNNFYVRSSSYKHSDKTNRHGISHGSYNDNDYGIPLNFYKTIGAVDFLCFIISLREPISFFAPSRTDESRQLAKLYQLCSVYSRLRGHF